MSGPDKIRLLCMEDDPGHALLVRHALERAGYEVDLASDSEDGLALSQQKNYAAIILDQHLPTRSGIEVLRILTSRAESPPIIMVTGAGSEGIAVEAMKLGASDYVRKDTDLTFLSLLPMVIQRARERQAILRAHRAAEDTLQTERAQLLSIFDSIEEGIYISDTATYEVLYANSAMKRHYGGNSLVGEKCYHAFHDRDAPCGFCTNPIILNNGGKAYHWEQENLAIHRQFALTDRMIRWSDGRHVRFCFSADITEHKRNQQKLEHLAYHDQLTGLPNRQLFRDLLENALALADRRGQTLGLLFIDVDSFKSVNDSLGHKAGDVLLRGMADRLRRCLRRSDTVARIGGDEFVILLPEITRPDDVGSIAAKIVGATKEPFRIEDQTVSGLCSIGTAVYPQDAASADALLRNADVALYQAKAMGGGTYKSYAPEVASEIRDHRALRARLLEALYRKELLVHFQPELNLATGEVRAAEALVRWMHPERGLLMPKDFLPLAKSVDLSRTIDLWIIETACQHAAQWQELVPAGFRVAVNLSIRLLRDPELVRLIEGILEQAGLSPEQLELEIPEAVVMEDLEASETQLGALRDLGVHLSLDDFGSGHTSLCHLHRLPLNSVKMDQQFVHLLEGGAKDRAISAAIVLLAHTLDLSVVAEGVETFPQLDLLVRHGCDAVQGYLFHPPLPAEALTRLLSRQVRFGWGDGCIRELGQTTKTVLASAGVTG